MNILQYIFTFGLIALTACGGKGAASNEAANTSSTPKVIPAFDADSAYSYVARQVEFGPRVPNSEAHRMCGDWMVSKLEEFGASDIQQQTAVLTAYDGTNLNVRNISASFNPNASKHILLLSHWDSRPWADQDPNAALRSKPIDGANDGASGVGVILEIARNIAKNQPKIGVDVLFVDAEDYGTRADLDDINDDESSWALGSQYWAQNPTLDMQKIRYAILLDMVGGENAQFVREYISQHYAANINDKVWKAADKAGFGDRFSNQVGMAVVDDHIYLLQTGLPAIDIIEINNPKSGGFNPTWHTHADNIENIDRETLRAVGQTLLQLIYNE